MKKTLIFVSFILVITTALTLFGFDTQDRENDNVGHVLDLAWDNYDVLAYSDLYQDSTLYFVIADSENESKFRKAVQKNLEQYNLEHYSLDIETESEANDY
jgi:hypothetical protein